MNTLLHPEHYNAAIELLQQASTSAGFVAAVDERDNYRRVWTRDGVICSIAACLSGNSSLLETAAATLHTIFGHQHVAGYMPSNVHPPSGAVSYGSLAGRADAPSWAIAGLCLYSLYTGDTQIAARYRPQVEKCMQLLEAWEYNGRQLIYVPQSGDWADEYIQHGYVLFDQLLRVWSLQLAARVYHEEIWLKKAASIRKVIDANYWKPLEDDGLYSPALGRQWQQHSGDYWLAGFNPSRMYSYFDLQANAWALLLNLGSSDSRHQVLTYVTSLMDQHRMLPSFDPVITSSDADYPELADNYAYSFRNEAYEFHNGGLWPVWNGWAVMALAQSGRQDLASRLAIHIHKANQQEALFNECFHGVSGLPCGVPRCAWSAAGAIIAEQALAGNFIITTTE